MSNPTVNQAKVARATRAIQNLCRDMNGAYLEKENEVAILANALIAEEPVVFLGEAGIGKSAIARSFAEAIEYTQDELGFWQYLFNKFTTPPEIFGTVSVKELRENDRYMVNPAGKMPQARVAFVDEIFKCNSATLNSMLTILNEKEFDDGSGVRKKVPLELCIGASNEMPEEDAGLEPLWDRFTLRYWSIDIQREDSFISLLTGEGIGKVDAKISREDIQTLRDLRDQVDITSVIKVFVELRDELQKAGIRVSSRRWRKAVTIVKAQVALAGRTVAKPQDCQILSAVLWDQPDEIAKVTQLLAKYASADDKEAIRLLDAARELHSQVNTNLSIGKIGQIKAGLQLILKDTEALNPSDTTAECESKIRGWLNDIERTVMSTVRGGRR